MDFNVDNKVLKEKMRQFLGGSQDVLNSYEKLQNNEERLNFLFHSPTVQDLFKNIGSSRSSR